MYRRLLLIALLGLTLCACVPYYDGGSTYYRSEVYTAPAPAYYYGGPRYSPYGRSYYAPAPRYYAPPPRYYSAPLTTSPRRVITLGPVTGPIRTRDGAIAGATVGMDGAPITEVVAAVTVKCFEKQAAPDAPLFLTVCRYCQI